MKLISTTSTLNMTQNSDFNLADFMPYQLSILSTRVSALIAQDYQARFGISIPEWRVIVVLASAGELSATGIAEATRMDKVRVTRTVQGLIGNQLATRRASLEDGRSTLLTLSAKGQEIYQEIIPLARKAEQDILSPLAEAEKTALQAIIDKMSDQLDQLDAVGDCSTASRA